ncbi:hypothetical protein RFI_30863, partial [Reticulomyxa filosa]
GKKKKKKKKSFATKTSKLKRSQSVDLPPLLLRLQSNNKTETETETKIKTKQKRIIRQVHSVTKTVDVSNWMALKKKQKKKKKKKRKERWERKDVHNQQILQQQQILEQEMKTETSMKRALHKAIHGNAHLQWNGKGKYRIKQHALQHYKQWSQEKSQSHPPLSSPSLPLSPPSSMTKQQIRTFVRNQTTVEHTHNEITYNKTYKQYTEWNFRIIKQPNIDRQNRSVVVHPQTGEWSYRKRRVIVRLGNPRANCTSPSTQQKLNHSSSKPKRSNPNPNAPNVPLVTSSTAKKSFSIFSGQCFFSLFNFIFFKKKPVNVFQSQNKMIHYINANKIELPRIAMFCCGSNVWDGLLLQKTSSFKIINNNNNNNNNNNKTNCQSYVSFGMSFSFLK